MLISYMQKLLPQSETPKRVPTYGIETTLGLEVKGDGS